jgi:hypothetical protein
MSANSFWRAVSKVYWLREAELKHSTTPQQVNVSVIATDPARGLSLSREAEHTNVIRDVSNSRGPERDFLCRGPKAFFLWGVPWLVFVLGASAPLALKTVLWTVSLGFMGVACLVNASRCGRIHCFFTGPFFILCAVVSLGYGLGLLRLGPSGWKWIGDVTIIGAIALCCIPELVLGRYRRTESDST